MGTFKVPIEVGDPAGQRWESVDAYADTGAMFSSVPRSVWQLLGLTPVRRAPLLMAAGRRAEHALAEGRVRIEGEAVPTLIVLADEASPPILGAHAMEGLFLAPDPVHQRLVPVEGLLHPTHKRLIPVPGLMRAVREAT